MTDWLVQGPRLGMWNTFESDLDAKEQHMSSQDWYQEYPRRERREGGLVKRVWVISGCQISLVTSP